MGLQLPEPQFLWANGSTTVIITWLVTFKNQININGLISLKIKNQQHTKFHEIYVLGVWSAYKVSSPHDCVAPFQSCLITHDSLCSCHHSLLYSTTSLISLVLYEGARVSLALHRLTHSDLTNGPRCMQCRTVRGRGSNTFPRNSKVLTKLSRIPCSVENTSATT
jgi:hypothetical protein